MASDLGLERLDCLWGRSWRAAELPGGLTNRNVRVVGDDGGPPLDLVVRCSSGDPGLLGIDRDAECANTRAAAAAGVGAEVLEYRPALGMLVIGYLPGTTLDDDAFADPAVLVRAADAVRRLHAGPAFTGEFDMAVRQADYRRTVAARGFPLPATYDDQEARWRQVCAALAVDPPPRVPCNNDLLAANFIDDGARVWLIDYEYSGTNDPFFELGNTATECGFDEDRTDAWVEAYLGRPPTRAELARTRLQRLASEYGWSLWGYIQAGAATLDFDFTGWGDERFEKAAATFRGPTLTTLLEDVTRG